MSEEICDHAFVEQAKQRWTILSEIDATTFPRLLELAESASDLQAQLTAAKLRYEKAEGELKILKGGD